MNNFPNELNVLNKLKFKNYNYEHILGELRNHIYKHIIKGDENDGFDIQRFDNVNTGGISSPIRKSTSEMVQTIIIELKELGWNCKLAYGNTELFIYSTDIKPDKCW